MASGNSKINRRTIFVSITKAQNGQVPDITPSTPLEDRARGFWFVDETKVDQCDLLVGVNEGTIEGVWEIDRDFGWRRMTATAIPTRHFSKSVVEPRRKYCQVKACAPEESVLVGRKLSSVSTVDRMCGPVRYNF